MKVETRDIAQVGLWLHDKTDFFTRR